MTTTVFVQIGNSDDKLTQAEWSDYVRQVDGALSVFEVERHFFGLAPSDSPWQNACWCVVFEDDQAVHATRVELARIAKLHRQHSIAWSVAETDFIYSASPDTPRRDRSNSDT